jgi:hypothetical protein
VVINYNGRRFRPVVVGPAEGPDGEHGRVALYRQDGDLLWGEFRGGRARRGALTGTCAPDGGLEFAYCMVTEDGEIISGRCASTPRVLDDGRIRLDEVWERYGPHAGSGVSSLEEIR